MMTKAQYTKAIIDLLEQCEDFQLVDLIYRLLKQVS